MFLKLPCLNRIVNIGLRWLLSGLCQNRFVVNKHSRNNPPIIHFPMLTHYPPRNFLSPIFLKICTNIPQDVPIIRDRIVFWNKALLKSYKALYFFGFFNSVTLYFKIYFWIFYCWKPELSWIRIRWNFWDISIGSQDISKTVFIFLTVNLHKNDDFRLFVT